MTKIVRRNRLVPNIHLLEVQAPEVARTCRPGQFIIVMPDEKGERIPLTIADWDRDKGTLTSVFMVVGTSTHKLSLLKAGDEIPVLTGPLEGLRRSNVTAPCFWPEAASASPRSIPSPAP